MRDVFATCPRCEAGLDPVDPQRLECGQCRGALVVDHALLDLISEAQIQTLLTDKKRKSPWRREEFASSLELGAPTEAGVRLKCPCCAADMAKHSLYGVEVDRCEAHGIWIDGDHELRLVLQNAAARI